MIKEALILAGGFGTRLGDLAKDTPKPMIEINGRPFLEYVLNFLILQRIESVVLSVGYKNEKIEGYFGNNYKGLDIKYVIEKKPLGTGGAIVKSMKSVEEDVFFTLNGDTFFNISFSSLEDFHRSKNSKITLALKEIKNTERYGFVSIDENGRINGFVEKTKNEKGFVNSGIYIIDKHFLSSLTFPEQFSFEKDFIEKNYGFYKFYGMHFNDYFIDIGISEDLDKARKDFISLFSSASRSR
jgi:D-glycero-alpha-D-manno-heptose 1-phosphate guanylyltransferase